MCMAASAADGTVTLAERGAPLIRLNPPQPLSDPFRVRKNVRAPSPAAQGGEEGPDVVDDGVGTFEGSEVSAAVMLAPLEDVRDPALRPPPRDTRDLAGEDRCRHGGLD